MSLYVVLWRNNKGSHSACCRRTPQRAIQERWEDRLSNPEVKAYLAKMLSYIFVSKKQDTSEKRIQRQLDRMLLEANSFKELFDALFTEDGPGDSV
jgi:hypothetical protein